MNINQRVKQVRKEMKLSQKDFGLRLGIGQAGVSWIEQSGNTLTDGRITSICKEFSVSENWLRTGEGNMHLKSREERLDEIAEELQLTPNQTKVFHILMGLPSEKREVIANAFFLICQENDRQQNELSDAAIQAEQADIRKEEETPPDKEDISV